DLPSPHRARGGAARAAPSRRRAGRRGERPLRPRERVLRARGRGRAAGPRAHAGDPAGQLPALHEGPPLRHRQGRRRRAERRGRLRGRGHGRRGLPAHRARRHEARRRRPTEVPQGRGLPGVPGGPGHEHGHAGQGRDPLLRDARLHRRAHAPDGLRVLRRPGALRPAVAQVRRRVRAARLQRRPRARRAEQRARDRRGQGAAARPGGLADLQRVARVQLADPRGLVLEVARARLEVGAALLREPPRRQRGALQDRPGAEEPVQRHGVGAPAGQAHVRAAGLHRRSVRRARQGLLPHRQGPLRGAQGRQRRQARGDPRHRGLAAVRLRRQERAPRVRQGEDRPRARRGLQHRRPPDGDHQQVRQRVRRGRGRHGADRHRGELPEPHGDRPLLGHAHLRQRGAARPRPRADDDRHAGAGRHLRRRVRHGRPARHRPGLSVRAALQQPRALRPRRARHPPDDPQGHDHRPGPPQRLRAPPAAQHHRGRAVRRRDLVAHLVDPGRRAPHPRGGRPRHPVRRGVDLVREEVAGAQEGEEPALAHRHGLRRRRERAGQAGPAAARQREEPGRVSVQVLRRRGHVRPPEVGDADLRHQQGGRRPLRPLRRLVRGPPQARRRRDPRRHGHGHRLLPELVGAGGRDHARDLPRRPAAPHAQRHGLHQARRPGRGGPARRQPAHLPQGPLVALVRRGRRQRGQAGAHGVHAGRPGGPRGLRRAPPPDRPPRRGHEGLPDQGRPPPRQEPAGQARGGRTPLPLRDRQGADPLGRRGHPRGVAQREGRAAVRADRRAAL
ncbi:MAG: hypothetical protein AVDCRST_MAG30-1737, partial [uncultured Solirubrobacteraceae bacterium]